MMLRRFLLAASLVALSSRLLQAQEARPVSLVVPVSRTAITASPAASPEEPASLPVGIVRAALSYLGTPYVHAGDSRAGLDCSGLIYRIFHDMTGLDLPRGVGALYRSARAVAYPLHIGDLLFFDTSGDASPLLPTHVGVYLGTNQFVHAASEGTRTGVIISTLSDAYYRVRFLGARRVIRWRDPVLEMTLTDERRVIAQDSPFPSQEALTIRIFNGMTGGGPVDLRVLKEGAEVLARRIVPGSQKPSELTIVPDIGHWTVSVSRIWKGRELQRMTFTVVE
ncbi:MAG: C40 family peptidase [Spirochaetia bacterium]|jgi:hypothetical protein